MKFALVSQSGTPSFQVKDGKAYLLNGDEYSHPDAIKNEFIIGIFNYPLVFTHHDTLSVVVGIASTANVMVIGDIERTV